MEESAGEVGLLVRRSHNVLKHVSVQGQVLIRSANLTPALRAIGIVDNQSGEDPFGDLEQALGVVGANQVHAVEISFGYVLLRVKIRFVAIEIDEDKLNPLILLVELVLHRVCYVLLIYFRTGLLT